MATKNKRSLEDTEPLNKDYKYILDDNGQWHRIGADDMTRTFEQLVVTPKGNKYNYVPKSIDNSEQGTKYRDKMLSKQYTRGLVGGRFQPVVEGYDENTYDKNGKLKRGVYKESTITTMSKRRSLDGSYGNVSGGRVLLKCDNETRVVSGSIEHVIQELELMQKNHKGKPVRYYQLDNGSYNRALRTRNGKNISEQDLRDYDKQNTTAAGGGHFMYIRN